MGQVPDPEHARKTIGIAPHPPRHVRLQSLVQGQATYCPL